MKEIDEAFNELKEHVDRYSFPYFYTKLEKILLPLLNLRKENFELYKALHGVKHPEDV